MTPPTPAARFLAQLQARDVQASLGWDGQEPRVLLVGGRILPGDFDKVKRYKAGLVQLLKPETAGDFMQCNVEHFKGEFSARLFAGDTLRRPSLYDDPPIEKKATFKAPKSVEKPRTRTNDARGGFIDETGKTYGWLYITGRGQPTSGRAQEAR